MLFDRVVSLQIGESGGVGDELAGLRIAFEIKKGATSTPNKSTVKIYNMAPSTRARVETVGGAVVLKAGYAQDAGLVTIFVGTITRATTTREGPDWITEIELQDGYFEYRDAKVSVSHPSGATVGRVIADMAGRFGLTVRALPTIPDKQYPTGFAYAGRVRDGLTRACEYAGLEWSIQNNELQLVAKGSAYRKQAYVLSPDTGLIGSPEPECKTMSDKKASAAGVKANDAGVSVKVKAGKASHKLKSGKMSKAGKGSTSLKVQGYKVKTLLQPAIEPGGYVQIKSKQIDGEFLRVESLEHSGDTHGPDWLTELVLRETNG